MRSCSALLLTFSLIACATPAPSLEREFAAPAERVREAALASLPGPAEEDAGVLRTGWIEGLSPDRAQGTILEGSYVRRYRLTVSLSGSRVGVSSVVEERAPGGTRALRWQRREPDGVAEREFLKKVEEKLR
jgi:hypothetical protein